MANGVARKSSVVSVDVGSGYVKAASHLENADARASFRSLVAEMPADFHRNFHGEEVKTIEYRGKSWLTGEDAARFGVRLADTLTDAWAGSEGWLVLLLKALWELGITQGEVHLVTGVPQAVYRDRAVDIRSSLVGKHNATIYGFPVSVTIVPARAMVLPQAAGGLYYWVAAEPSLQEVAEHNGLIAGVDVGTYTTGYAVLEGRSALSSLSGGAEIGMSNVALALSKKIYKKFRVQPDQERAMRYLEERKKVFFNGALHDISDLVQESVSEVVSPFLLELRSTWGSRAGNMAIGVYGGGSEDFLPMIQETFPHAQRVRAEDVGGARFLPALGMLVFFAGANHLLDRVSS